MTGSCSATWYICMRRTSDIRIRVNGAAYRVLQDKTAADAACFRETEPRLGGMIRFETFLGAFSADAVCAAALYCAQRRGDRQNGVVFVECSGSETMIPVVVNPATGKATAILPVPNLEAEREGTLLVRFPGVACLVCRSGSVQESHWTGITELAVLCDASGTEIKIFRRDSDAPWRAVPADGLAAAAAAAAFAQADFPDGVTEHDISMHGFSAEVGVSMRAGVLSGISVCSRVELSQDEE